MSSQMRSRLAANRRTTVVVAVVVVLAAVGATTWLLAAGGAKAEAAPATAAVKRGTVTVTASASGTVKAVNSRALTFGTNGTVLTLGVKAGDKVVVGQTLATLDATDAQAAVTSATATLEAAETNLTLATDQAANPSPTASTCVNTAAFVIHPTAPPTPSPSPSTTPSTTPSPTPTPTGTRSPTGPPSPTGTSPRGTGGNGSGTGGPTCGNTNGTGNGGNGRGASAGTDALLRAQQAVNNATYAREQAETRLAGTKLVAPITGRVLSVSGAVGQTASAGGTGFIVLGGFDALVVQAEFSEADVAPVEIGQAASVTLANHPGKTYEASVTEIDPAGTTSGQLVRYGVQLTFGDVPADLLLGQSATVAVTTASASDVLYVPTAALAPTGAGHATVTVRTPSGDTTREVTTGLEGDQGTEIAGGLTGDETVVLSR